MLGSLLDYIRNKKFGSGSYCPKCKSENIREGARIGYKSTGSAFEYRCRDCGYEWIQ